MSVPEALIEEALDLADEYAGQVIESHSLSARGYLDISEPDVLASGEVARCVEVPRSPRRPDSPSRQPELGSHRGDRRVSDTIQDFQAFKEFHNVDGLTARRTRCFDCPNMPDPGMFARNPVTASARSRIGARPHRCHNDLAIACAGPLPAGTDFDQLEREEQALVFQLMRRQP